MNLKEKLDSKSVGKKCWAFDREKLKWYPSIVINTRLDQITFLSIGISPSGYSEFNNFKVRTSIGKEFYTGLLGFLWQKPAFYGCRISK